MGKRSAAHRVSVQKPEGKRPLGNLSVHGRIILKWVYKSLGWSAWIGFIWLSIQTQ